MNPTNSYVTINSKTLIGLMQEVEIVKPFIYKPNNGSEQFKFNHRKIIKNYLNTCKISLNIHAKNYHLNCQELRQLLLKHETVLAKYSSDLGRTSEVKHNIYVGNNQPIQRSPWRAPRTFAIEEDKITEEQLRGNKRKYKPLG